MDDQTKWPAEAITPGPWKWKFLGTAGNYFLLGNNGEGPIAHGVPGTPDGNLMEAAPLMLAALEMVEAASTIYDSDELTPAQLEIQQAAKAAGVTPVEYVMSAVHAAIAAARRARGSSDDRR